MEFRFEYHPGTISYGPIAGLGEELGRIGVEDALVVCGRTVGSTPAVMDPVRAGLGDRLGGVFAGTTPDKHLGTAVEAAERLTDLDADAVVGLGGGSSLDLAKVTAVVAGSDRPVEDLVADLAERGGIAVPESVPPVVAVPTTLAGADCSQMAGVSASPEAVERATGRREPAGGGVSDPRLMPLVLWYDPDLFRTTPDGVLCGSAMNGFDKAVEAPYARAAIPITDATASRALSMLSSALPRLGEGDRDDRTMRDAVVGTVLAQYGASRPDAVTLSVIHAFGHGLRDAGLQQGVGHAVVAPHALRHLFGAVDGRRELLAAGLGVDADGLDDDAVDEAVVEAVATVRDGLGLPATLRAVDGPDREDLPAVARAVAGDGLLDNAPPGLGLDAEAALEVLEAAW